MIIFLYVLPGPDACWVLTRGLTTDLKSPHVLVYLYKYLVHSIQFGAWICHLVALPDWSNWSLERCPDYFKYVYTIFIYDTDCFVLLFFVIFCAPVYIVLLMLIVNILFIMCYLL